jgi:hypothetical protein
MEHGNYSDIEAFICYTYVTRFFLFATRRFPGAGRIRKALSTRLGLRLTLNVQLSTLFVLLPLPLPEF